MDKPAFILAERLVEFLRPLGPSIVAYSGGVDSAVVAKAAQLALGCRALAVTGVSASLAAGELQSARQIAAEIGIRHVELETNELADPGYLQNAPDRCYHCKTELYSKLAHFGAQHGIGSILNGANTDDLGDFRPGMEAARRHGVHSPLAECGLAKNAVRSIAQYWGLEVWDKPATPCLSSRVAYGLGISPARLTMIDRAEQALRAHGLGNVRVRLHENDLARLEVPLTSLQRLCEEPVRAAIVTQLRELGFRYVTIDLEGFRSGSFLQLVPVAELTRFAPPSS